MILARYKNAITYILIALIYASVAVRGLSDFYASDNDLAEIGTALILLYGLLLATERWITRRYSKYIHLYLAIQTIILFAILIFSPQLDYFALLFIPLSIQAMLYLPIRPGYIWIGIFTAVTAVALIISYGWRDALPFIFIYAAAFLFVASYATATRQAEEAQQKSQTLLAELQKAHVQLKDYTRQAKELAVLEERTRLARDLHDSVTQALYSLTLYSAAAARQLEAGDVEKTAENLHELQLTAQQALQEMRLLIFELRPSALAEIGLAGAIKARLEAVETRTGIDATFEVSGEAVVPPEIEEGLYGITQESLNNILKHAQAAHILVKLDLHPKSAILEIEDDGIGFDRIDRDYSLGLGLSGMQERAQQMGSQLTVKGTPGQGTHVRVVVPL